MKWGVGIKTSLVPAILASALALLLMVTTPTEVRATSIIDTATNNGHTYHLLSPDTWENSEAYALTLGGHLVTINDSSENTFVANTFTADDPNRYLWIGFTDKVTEGTWLWISGEVSPYDNWSLGEPNNFNGVEDYALIWAPNHHFGYFPAWNDAVNDLGFNGVVELPFIGSPGSNATTVPEPVTLVLFASGLLGFGAVARRRRRPNAIVSRGALISPTAKQARLEP